MKIVGRLVLFLVVAVCCIWIAQSQRDSDRQTPVSISCLSFCNETTADSVASGVDDCVRGCLSCQHAEFHAWEHCKHDQADNSTNTPFFEWNGKFVDWVWIVCTSSRKDGDWDYLHDEAGGRTVIWGNWSKEYFCDGKFNVHVLDRGRHSLEETQYQMDFRNRCIAEYGPKRRWPQPSTVSWWSLFRSGDGTLYGYFAGIHRTFDAENPAGADSPDVVFSKADWEREKCAKYEHLKREAIAPGQAQVEYTYR